MSGFDPTTLFFSIIFSSIGLGYFYYGKKDHLYFLIAGLGLMIYPYFVDSLLALILVGFILTILPFILDRISPL